MDPTPQKSRPRKDGIAGERQRQDTTIQAELSKLSEDQILRLAKDCAEHYPRASVAFHEAGHVLAYKIGGAEIERVAIFHDGTGLMIPKLLSVEHLLNGDFCFEAAAGIAAELRFTGTPAPDHPDLAGYLKAKKPEIFPSADWSGPMESDLLALFRWHFPRRKYRYLSPRKRRKFYALAAKDVRDADARLAPDWELIRILAAALLEKNTLLGEEIDQIFDAYAARKKGGAR